MKASVPGRNRPPDRRSGDGLRCDRTHMRDGPRRPQDVVAFERHRQSEGPSPDGRATINAKIRQASVVRALITSVEKPFERIPRPPWRVCRVGSSAAVATAKPGTLLQGARPQPGDRQTVAVQPIARTRRACALPSSRTLPIEGTPPVQANRFGGNDEPIGADEA